jgi:hypothetical protein
VKLWIEIQKEKKKVGQDQVTKERDILEQEGEVSILNTILTQERKILLEKEAEVENLRRFRIPFHVFGVQMESIPPPSRPPRTKSLVITANMQVVQNLYLGLFYLSLPEQANIRTEEDVLIEDLELDEETDDRQHRRRDT